MNVLREVQPIEILIFPLILNFVCGITVILIRFNEVRNNFTKFFVIPASDKNNFVIAWIWNKRRDGNLLKIRFTTPKKQESYRGYDDESDYKKPNYWRLTVHINAKMPNDGVDVGRNRIHASRN